MTRTAPYRNDVLIHLLPSATIIFDIGANHGQSTLSLSSIFPEATFHCFEPDRRNFDVLEQKFGSSQKVCLFNLAVSSVANEERTFHLSSFDQASSFLSAGEEYKKRGIVSTQESIVRTTTIDAHMADHGIPKVDFCKIDTQGFSQECLIGAQKALSSGAISCLQVELLFANYYEKSDSFYRIEELLVPHGYKLFTLVDTDTDAIGSMYIDYETGMLKHLDAIYVHKSLEAR